MVMVIVVSVLRVLLVGDKVGLLQCKELARLDVLVS